MTNKRFSAIDVLRKWWMDGAALLLLCVCAAKFLAGYRLTHDVSLFDETWSLVRGVELCRFNFTKIDYEPAYQLWYYLLNHLIPDRIQLFYANIAIIITLGILLIYVLLRVNKVPIVYSLAAAVFFLGSAFVHVIPWNAYFALTIVLATMITVSLLREGNRNIAVSALIGGLLLTTLVRPEFFMSSVVALCYGIVLAIRSREYRFIAFQAVPVLLVVLIFGVPGVRTGRDWIAFQQHYAFRLAQTRHLSCNPWLHAPMITDAVFPGAHHLSDALRINAPAVFQHMRANVADLPGVFKRLLMTPRAPHWVGNLQVALFVLLLLAGLFALRTRYRDPLSFAALCFLLAPATSVSVIYPRDHYLIIPCAILLTMSLIWLAKRLPTPPLIITGLLGMILLAYTPNTTTGFCLLPSIHPVYLPVRDTIATLKTVHPHHIVEIDGGYGVYIPGTRSTLAFQIDRPIMQYINAEGVDTIVVSHDMLNYAPLAQDAAFQYFLQHYPSLGYSAKSISQAGRIVILYKLIGSARILHNTF